MRWMWCVLGLSACGSTDSGDLVTLDRWELVAPAMDPIPGRTAEPEPCSPDAAVIEDERLELRTDVCDWITVAGPLEVALRRGDPIELLLFHSALNAPEPATATVAVWTSDGALWQEQLEVPSPEGIFDVELEVPTAMDVGDPLFVHVHNHGDNAYTLAYLRTPDL